MNEETDYRKLLEETEAEIAELQAVAAFFRRKIGLASEVGATTPSTPPIPKVLHGLTESSIPTDAFFNMAVPEAIVKYLGITKKPRSVQAITEALEQGGLHTVKTTNVYTSLNRGKGKRFSKVKRDWGLAEWYR